MIIFYSFPQINASKFPLFLLMGMVSQSHIWVAFFIVILEFFSDRERKYNFKDRMINLFPLILTIKFISTEFYLFFISIVSFI